MRWAGTSQCDRLDVCCCSVLRCCWLSCIKRQTFANLLPQKATLFAQPPVHGAQGPESDYTADSCGAGLSRNSAPAECRSCTLLPQYVGLDTNIYIYIYMYSYLFISCLAVGRIDFCGRLTRIRRGEGLVLAHGRQGAG